MSDMNGLKIPGLRAPLGHVIGETLEIHKIYQIVHQAALTTHPVLIVGEAGTGKEMIARTIHSTGPLRHMRFTRLDCASLPAETLQAELQLSSLTPTTEFVETPNAAYSGTLFLDRVGDLNLSAQALLLRTIHDREIWTSPDSVQRGPRRLRILASTERDLKLGVAEGKFRRDLYFRLNVLSLRVPPLRERRRDILLLISSFLCEQSQMTGSQRRIGEEALQAMLTYDWPGNVRELKSCVEHACCSATKPILQLLDLPSVVSGIGTRVSMSLPGGRVLPLYELEKRSIMETMLQVRGNKRMAAQLLGIGKTTLYRKLKEYTTRERESK